MAKHDNKDGTIHYKKERAIDKWYKDEWKRQKQNWDTTKNERRHREKTTSDISLKTEYKRKKSKLRERAGRRKRR